MSKPRGDPSCGTSSEDVLIPTERHPAYRQREARSGSGTERENLADDAKGKGASGSHREAESTDASERGGLPRISDEGPVMGLERRRWVIAADVGQLVRREEPLFSGRRQPSCDGTSRMMREYPVRICEGLGVKFPGPTRRFALALRRRDAGKRRHERGRRMGRGQGCSPRNRGLSGTAVREQVIAARQAPIVVGRRNCKLPR